MFHCFTCPEGEIQNPSAFFNEPQAGHTYRETWWESDQIAMLCLTVTSSNEILVLSKTEVYIQHPSGGEQYEPPLQLTSRQTVQPSDGKEPGFPSRVHKETLFPFCPCYPWYYKHQSIYI